MDPGTPPPAARRCPTDNYLRLCIDFDDQATLTGDGSGRNHDAISTGISVMPRGGEQAALLSASSRITVAETLDLDITSNLTIAMFVRPEAAPDIGDAFWALDNNRQYALSYEDTTQFRCGLGTKTVDSGIWFPPGRWHHVACTFDQAAAMLKIYVDGYAAGCRRVTGPISTDGGEGLAIGANIGANQSFSDRFIGGIDNVQVYARTLPGAELCTAAGGSGCTDTCPFIAD